jgi:hypothetical protein
MSFLDKFRTQPPFLLTDKTDRSSFHYFRRTHDGTPGPKTGLPLPDETDKTPARQPEPPELNAQDSWEWIVERAAIFEFDGGLCRDEAELRAFEAWYQRFVGERRSA